MSRGTTLANRQQAFMQAILDEAAPLPAGLRNRHAAGLAVYRGNYRSALIEALGETYERTKLYIGDGPFAQAAAHHAIAYPPTGWTIDHAGAGFDQTCAGLFADNPEVAELAWLEWTMQRLASARDNVPLDRDGFAQATAAFGESEWMALRLVFQPRVEARKVSANLTGLWRTVGEDSPRPAPLLEHPRGCIAWREQFRPTFMLTDPSEVLGLATMKAGATFGEMITALAQEHSAGQPLETAAERAGQMLGGWIEDGIVARVIS